MKLFKNLRQLRVKLSILENVPAYFDLHDSVLKKIAIKRPKTKKEIMKIPGIAQKKFDKYGEQFLKEVKEFEGVL